MAVDFLGALGAGSDIDSKSLVESLVAAERAPRESSLNKRISESETEISAYGVVLASLESLDMAFEKLNDASDFNDFAVNVIGGETSGGSASFSVTADATEAEVGATSISVTSLASADRWASNGFNSLTDPFNGGSAFTVTFLDSDKNTLASIAISDTTPQGVVDAINNSDLADYGTASIIDTGSDTDRYRIVLAGELGADNAFTVATTAGGSPKLEFQNHLNTAADSRVVINGLTVQRPTNTIDDVIDGVTVNLLGQSASTGSLSITRTTTGVKDRITELVDVYNAVDTQFEKLGDPDSTEDLGGSLSSDAVFRNISTKVKQLFSGASSTPGTNVSYLSEIGVSFTRYGKLEIDEDRLDESLVDHFDDIVTIFSANTDNQSNTGDASRGIAGDAIKTISELTANDGPVRSRSSTLESRIDDYEEDLEELDRKMQQIYSRYLAQFTAMEKAVDQMNNTKEYLKTALEALPFTNKNN